MNRRGSPLQAGVVWPTLPAEKFEEFAGVDLLLSVLVLKSYMKHPKTIEEISAPWLSEVLRSGGILKRATVRAVTVQAIGQGVGFLSGRARVTISYDQPEAGAPGTVVVKLPASIKEGVTSRNRHTRTSARSASIAR